MPSSFGSWENCETFVSFESIEKSQPTHYGASARLNPCNDWESATAVRTTILSGALACVTHLTALTFDGSHITDAGIRSLSSLNRLTELSLAGHARDLHGSGFEALRGLAKLHTLGVAGSGLDDEGVAPDRATHWLRETQPARYLDQRQRSGGPYEPQTPQGPESSALSAAANGGFGRARRTLLVGTSEPFRVSNCRVGPRFQSIYGDARATQAIALADSRQDPVATGDGGQPRSRNCGSTITTGRTINCGGRLFPSRDLALRTSATESSPAQRTPAAARARRPESPGPSYAGRRIAKRRPG